MGRSISNKVKTAHDKAEDLLKEGKAWNEIVRTLGVSYTTVARAARKLKSKSSD